MSQVTSTQLPLESLVENSLALAVTSILEGLGIDPLPGMRDTLGWRITDVRSADPDGRFHMICERDALPGEDPQEKGETIQTWGCNWPWDLTDRRTLFLLGDLLADLSDNSYQFGTCGEAWSFSVLTRDESCEIRQEIREVGEDPAVVCAAAFQAFYVEHLKENS